MRTFAGWTISVTSSTVPPITKIRSILQNQTALHLVKRSVAYEEAAMIVSVSVFMVIWVSTFSWPYPTSDHIYLNN
jgi:hypothetical protein